MTRRRFAGQKCFLTGAASGIGRATALAAAARGAELFLTDIDADGLAAVVADIERAGGTVHAHAALDVTDLAALRTFVAQIHAAHGSVDVVMNIAGISLWGPVELLTEQHWQRVVDVNLMGPIHVIQCLVPAMIAAGRGGHLVNVSSAAGLFGLPWHAAYSASKFGLRGLSEVLRFDLQRHRIGVSLVCPGGVDTPLVETVKIVGVDTSRPQIQALRRRFRAHAVAPAVAAAAILDGVERGRYMIYTSLDIRVGHFFQRVFPWGYEFVMRRLNDALHRVVSQ
jgi:NAD(P)-dependent dehydrogenase (short-subunit alcohol dehydrogenase family)